jgi:hypothetical protein
MALNPILCNVLTVLAGFKIASISYTVGFVAGGFVPSQAVIPVPICVALFVFSVPVKSHCHSNNRGGFQSAGGGGIVVVVGGIVVVVVGGIVVGEVVVVGIVVVVGATVVVVVGATVVVVGKTVVVVVLAGGQFASNTPVPMLVAGETFQFCPPGQAKKLSPGFRVVIAGCAEIAPLKIMLPATNAVTPPSIFLDDTGNHGNENGGEDNANCNCESNENKLSH